MKGLEVYHVAYLTSDSDYSDTESGKLAYLAKEQAKTRHATFNLIIRLSNVSIIPLHYDNNTDI